MAYLAMLREWRAGWLTLTDRLPLPCLLCGSRIPGGLCLHCSRAVTASMNTVATRCLRCELGGGDGRSAASCPDCTWLEPALVRVVAAFDYTWPGELLIYRLKRHGKYACAPLMARLLAQRCQALRETGEPLWSADALLTAVPAGRAALRQRGYNPAAEVGRALAHRLGLAWHPGLLQRAHDGETQKDLSRQARRQAVLGLYRCTGDIRGREVVVVDDVMTTGSTLSAIAQALQARGASRVWGAVIARTPWKSPHLP